MELSAFLSTLFNQSKIIVSRELHDFEQADVDLAVELITEVYNRDVLTLPAPAPAFDAGAALWAAKSIFRSVQFLLLRDLDAELMNKWLPFYNDKVTAASVYSADLLLRNLGSLIELGKNLAPADPLINHLRQLAAAWPFSSVGLNIEPSAEGDVILSHPSLRYAYGDRIIKKRDETRRAGTEELLTEIMGMHIEQFWPA